MYTAMATRHLSDIVPSRAAARLRAFRREAQLALGGNVESVVLFGSRARGDARSDSDYDVAVFVHDMAERRSIDHLLADAAYRHVLSGFHIRPLALPSEFLKERSRSALASSIARDGVVVL